MKERLGKSDRETVEQICENPYLQYFLGLPEYEDKPPFDQSMMTHFRKRFDKDILSDINEKIVESSRSMAFGFLIHCWKDRLTHPSSSRL